MTKKTKAATSKPTAPEMPSNIVAGMPVFVRWPGSELPHNRKRAIFVRWNKNGGAIVQIARVEQNGAYNGKLGDERTFAAGDIIGPIHADVKPETDTKLLSDLSNAMLDEDAKQVSRELAKTESHALMCTCDGVVENRHVFGSDACKFLPDGSVRTVAVQCEVAAAPEAPAPWE